MPQFGITRNLQAVCLKPDLCMLCWWDIKVQGVSFFCIHGDKTMFLLVYNRVKLRFVVFLSPQNEGFMSTDGAGAFQILAGSRI